MIQTIHSLEELPAISDSVHLALGVFDGVHIGHQAVIQQVVESARAQGGIAGVLTFEPHPIRVLAPQNAPRRILASIQHKEDLLAELGVELLIVIPFTEAFAEYEAEEFLLELKNACGSLKTLSMGDDWKFGRKRRGDVQLLKHFGLAYGVEVKTASPVRLEGERVSSTRIRQAIRDGNLDAVSEMLGREFSVWGTVIEGKQLGRSIGFPTANLRVYNEQLPPDGVWVVDVTLDQGEIVRGAGNLGVRPTVDGKQGRRLLEVHLIDCERDLYGQGMEVRFLHWVRGEQTFEGLDALKAQIAEDVAFCRNWSGI
ncbi:bifunctional riboflavin kinase/FAD synthetase [Verrucomicrobiaceae bacterium N1E253]|uniref:Riboflavin biosynthesis protein n=1 Tax=Oceaniferula marina TaxID=2748318 RepID=A0A851G914_9BACT|nr:bifunctional riboflavin kinase/FAD synthetase [Oceaniferula marina]NWK54208.1 bifunctional riboflavin kinase/FAD synthetase [Oceaniferula marina]